MTRQDVARLHSSMSDRPVQANRTLAILGPSIAARAKREKAAIYWSDETSVCYQDQIGRGNRQIIIAARGIMTYCEKARAGGFSNCPSLSARGVAKGTSNEDNSG